MYQSKVAYAIASIVSSLCAFATATSAPSGSALALIESQKDLTLIAGLVRNYPDITELYSTVKNVTIFAAPDSTFTDTNPKSILYTTNAEFTKSILRAVVIKGVYPASAITTTPEYPSTKLTSPRFVDNDRGVGVAKLKEVNGKKTVTVGSGGVASVVTPDLTFNGGVLHKISNPLALPQQIFDVAGVLKLKAYTAVDPITISLVQVLETAKASTIFSLTNEAAAANVPSTTGNATASEIATAAANVIEYFVVHPGIYAEDKFDGRTVTTINGFKLKLAGAGTGKLTVNDAVVAQSDILLTNGVAHLLDRPLVPLEEAASGPK